MKDTYSWWAWLFSVGCFLMYVAHSVPEIISKYRAAATVVKKPDSGVKDFAGGDITKFGEMLAKLVEAFSKLSGAGLALAGSVAFLFIAMYLKD